ncbi:MAG: MbnP family protein [Chitinophagaceae bacterium]
MKSRVTRANLLLALSLCLIIVSCQKKAKDDVTPPGAPSPVEFRFEHKVDLKNLVLDSSYGNQFQEFFKVSNFKYYISNIQFVDQNSGDTVKIPETYFLVDERKPESKKAQFTIPAGEYYACSFLIGIDAERNASGAQTGALDPALGMFWNRTDGYIMAKLEGTSPASTLPGNVISYHIGGYKGATSVIARRHFKIGAAAVMANRKTVVIFTTDVRDWFSNPHALKIETYPSVSAPGDLAKKFSENYFKMFDFSSVKYE